MRIIAIPATNSRNGINRQLLTHVAWVLENDLEAKVALADIDDYEMSIYSPEREQAAGGPPAEAHQLFGRISAADGNVISFAEHNGSYSAAWKNLYDWMSRIDQNVFQHKPTVLLAATPGPRAGAGVLASASGFLPHAGAELVGTLGIGRFGETFDDETGTITNPDIETRLRSLLGDLVTSIQA
jgi:chromate reductase